MFNYFKLFESMQTTSFSQNQLLLDHLGISKLEII